MIVEVFGDVTTCLKLSSRPNTKIPYLQSITSSPDPEMDLQTQFRIILFWYQDFVFDLDSSLAIAVSKYLRRMFFVQIILALATYLFVFLLRLGANFLQFNQPLPQNVKFKQFCFLFLCFLLRSWCVLFKTYQLLWFSGETFQWSF